MITKEKIALRLAGLILAGLATGYGITELDRLVESKHVQKAVDTTVEIVKQPEKAFQGQSQPIATDRLLLNPIQYELPKPLVIENLCQYYPDMQKCLEIAQKGGQKNEKAEN